jgi:hypothetical protein
MPDWLSLFSVLPFKANGASNAKEHAAQRAPTEERGYDYSVISVASEDIRRFRASRSGDMPVQRQDT